MNGTACSRLCCCGLCCRLLPPAPCAFASKFARPAASATIDSDLFAFGKELPGEAGATSDRKNFTKQYAAIYFCRLNALKQVVLQRAQQALTQIGQQFHSPADGSPPRLCPRILDIVPEQYCVIAGTLYKDMKLKPSILQEYSKSAGSAVANTAEGSVYMSADDTLGQFSMRSN